MLSLVRARQVAFLIFRRDASPLPSFHPQPPLPLDPNSALALGAGSVNRDSFPSWRGPASSSRIAPLAT
jgi:hypothetical protein